jgi:putative integral membrane protein (TIGR02587 family)
MQRQATISRTKTRTADADRSIAKSLQEYGRGVAGGLLFSLPILYTMEMWWAGFITHPARLLVYILATFGLLLGYNRYAGLRRDASFGEVAIDSVEELGLGLVVSALTLWLLGRVSADRPIAENLGQIVIEAMMVAIGVSVGTAQLGAAADDAGEDDSGQDGAAEEDAEHASHFPGQAIIALCGAMLVGANVAPTEEIVMLAVESTPLQLIALVALSLGLCALILFYSDFTGARRFVSADNLARVLGGTAQTYMLALLASAAALWFFGRFDGNSFSVCLAETVVLGVASSIGASAGRLLMQSSGGG